MIELIEPEAPAQPAEAPAAAVAVVPPPPAELVKLDLQAVALAHFGDWRAQVAAVRANLSTLALDLSIPARVADAKTLRMRLIGTPRAEVRKTSAALKSKLAAVSKAVGAEADAAVAAYDDAETLITPQIEAAEQRIEAERKAREAAEAVAPADDAPAASVAIVGAPAVQFSDGQEFGVYRVPAPSEPTLTLGAAPPAPPVLADDDGPLETSEADARPYVAPPAAAPAPAVDPRDEFVALVMTAFDCKFPTHPKPPQEWWAKVRAAGDALRAKGAA